MRRKLLISVFLLAALTVLCACKDGTNKANSPEKPSSEAPSYGGSIVVGITQDMDSLDPHKAVAAGTSEVLFNVFEGLLKINKDGNFDAAVAERYTISEDALVYTFILRDNVKFHNGDTVTVDDVVYSIKRCAGLLDVSDPMVLVDSALSVISEVSAPDNKTVVLTLSKPNTELLYYLTGAIIPCDYQEQDTAPVGTGPFRFVSYSPMESFVMERFEDYYGEKAYLDRVTFKIYTNIDSAFLELMAGKIDIFPYLMEEHASQLEGRYTIDVGKTNLVQGLFLNNERAPFDDIRVRQALCYAVNRQEIMDMLSGGKGTIIGSSMLPAMSKYYKEELAQYYSYDIEKARQLLTQAGYPEGFELTITVPSNYPYYMATAQIIIEQLKPLGIQTKIKPVEWATWLSEVYAGREYQSTIISFDCNLAPNDILKRYCSDSKSNLANYKSEAFDTAFSTAFHTVLEETKIANYKLAQEILCKDAASVYLQDPASLTAVKKELGGYVKYPIYAQDMSLVYYKK